MVELELPECRERPVSRLEPLKATSILLVELVEDVCLGIGLSEKGKRDDDHAGDRQSRRKQQSDRQRVAGIPTSLARATSLRCSRRSGQSVMTDPRRNTSPASQMRLTSGLTKTRK